MVARERRWRIMDKRLGRAENECGCRARVGEPATSGVRVFAVSMESGGPRRYVLIGARWGSAWEAELVEPSWVAAGGLCGRYAGLCQVPCWGRRRGWGIDHALGITRGHHGLDAQLFYFLGLLRIGGGAPPKSAVLTDEKEPCAQTP